MADTEIPENPDTLDTWETADTPPRDSWSGGCVAACAQGVVLGAGAFLRLAPIFGVTPAGDGVGSGEVM